MTTAPPCVELRLPPVLDPVVGTERLRVRGRHLAEALAHAFALEPALRRHLVLETGRLRPHLLCFHNGSNVQGRLEDVALSEGDEICIHQAISGG